MLAIKNLQRYNLKKDSAMPKENVQSTTEMEQRLSKKNSKK
jgi:hypothetical protein